MEPRNEMRRWNICNVDVHRASLAKHLRSKNYLENKKKIMNIPQWLFKQPLENKKTIYNPKPLTPIARHNINVDDKQLNKKLANRMLNPYYFTDRALRFGFIIKLDGHHIIRTNSKIIIKPNYPEFGIEVRYINKIIKKLSVICSRLMNQYTFKYKTVFPARFDKQDEDNQVLDETD